jgi:uncharacterized integral membrane protein
MIRLILFILLIFFLFTLSYTNSQVTVPIHYFWGWESKPVRIDVLILVAFLSGMLLALVFLLPGWIQMRLEIRKKRRYIEQLEAERDHVRAAQLGAESRPPSGLSAEEEIDEI